jgi:DNA-binding transcriptional LysR family regulator
MKIDQLAYFLETSKTGHIGLAAKKLGISPSAISHSIADLEQELGLPLFEKIGKSIYLTEHGKELAQKVAPILLSITQLKNDLQSADIEPTGKFNIAAAHGLADKWLLPLINQLQLRYKKIVFEFSTMRSAQIVEEIAKGSLDFGICYSPLSQPLIKIQSLFDDPMYITCRKGHPLLSKKNKNFSEYPCALPKALLGVEVCEDHPMLKKFKIKSDVTFVFDSYDIAANKIISSDAWSLIPDFFIQYYGLKKIVPIGWEATARICLVTPKSRPLPNFLEEAILNLKL